MSMHIKLAPLA